jgi:hypothetical protein
MSDLQEAVDHAVAWLEDRGRQSVGKAVADAVVARWRRLGMDVRPVFRGQWMVLWTMSKKD